MEVAAEHLREHEDQLPMVHRLDDLFFDKAAENLRALLLARWAYASSLATIRNKDLVPAGGTLRACETCMQTTAVQIRLEGTSSRCGQGTVLFEEALVVRLVEEVEVLGDGTMEVRRFGMSAGGG